jgi:hypothetical protein
MVHPMFVLADKALTVTIVSIAIWFVLFPMLVTGIIVFAIVQARGEQRRYELTRQRMPGTRDTD